MPMARYADLHETILPILCRLLADAPLPHTGCMLDLACGDTAKWPIYREILGPEVRLLGIDWDRATLPSLPITGYTTGSKSSAQKSALVVGDAHQLPFSAASFDAALCIAAFGLFADAQRVLAELQRVLCPGAPALIFTAERRWVQVLHWPATLAARLNEAALHTTLPLAHTDLIGDLVATLHHSGFAHVAGRAFLLEENLPPAAAELALLPWADVRPLLAANLTPTELMECDLIAPEIDLCSVGLACVAHN